MPESLKYNERELLLAISQGSETSFKQIFELYSMKLYSYVYNFTHNDLDTEEIIQEVFIRLWESKNLLSEVEYPGSYIFTLARNHTYKYLRHAAKSEQLIRELWLIMQNEADQTEDMFDGKEIQNLLDDALSHLSETKQKVFRLRQSGLKYEEISTQLKLSKSTVKNVMVEIMKFLKDYFTKHKVHISLILLYLYSI